MPIDPALKALVDRIYSLPNEALVALQAELEPMAVAKKAFIFKEGDAVPYLYFIKSGVYRGFYNKEVDDITTSFYFGPTFYADVLAIREGIPTRFNVQALEGGEVWRADMRSVEKAGEGHPALLRLFIRFYEVIYTFTQRRQLSFIFDSAEERYKQLIQERPKVIANIPQAYIASYLGIKPESLSRIRGKMAHP